MADWQQLWFTEKEQRKVRGSRNRRIKSSKDRS
jgi:hypothetical protein